MPPLSVQKRLQAQEKLNKSTKLTTTVQKIGSSKLSSHPMVKSSKNNGSRKSGRRDEDSATEPNSDSEDEDGDENNPKPSTSNNRKSSKSKKAKKSNKHRKPKTVLESSSSDEEEEQRLTKGGSEETDAETDWDSDDEFEIDEILDRGRLEGKTYYLVSWGGDSKGYTSWEPENNLTNAHKAIRRFEKRLKHQARLHRLRQAKGNPSGMPWSDTKYVPSRWLPSYTSDGKFVITGKERS